MAFLKRKSTKAVEDFICTMDSAIDEQKTNMETYRESWDAADLVFKEGQKPTIFKIRMDLPRKQNTEVKNASIGVDKKGRAKFALGDHEFELVRSILVGIDNPADGDPADILEWKKGNDGVTDDKVMDELCGSGVAEEIYAFYHKAKRNREEDLKKS